MAKRGRKTKYHPSYARQAEVACVEGGFTDAKLAKLFDVSITTITTWKRKYPEFLASVKRGKDEFDSMKVEASLLKKALGTKVKKITKEPFYDEKSGKTKMVVTKTEVTDLLGDTTAQIFFLKNRQPQRWRDKQVHEHEGEIKIPALEVVIEK